MSVVALLVLATTILFPLLQLCILFYLLVPLARERRPAGFACWCALMQSLQALGNDRGVPARRAGGDRQAVEHGAGACPGRRCGPSWG